ncbi:DoxX family protein [Vibrio tubiashii]|uniref:DoxX family protein n=1 Tax=Vibrio tubiashii TaxID=29498 RepID=UPI001EFEBBB2|nr:DoxX family protein [Vibrio tubiashii]MCG9582472.1 DoxX family protein [Vibrio tubiashii]MCG9616063.1 DoxX family protein [Vibrio tubiashii]MCG9689873.1 DoxX family protein [Vibrio tubiashii]
MTVISLLLAVFFTFASSIKLFGWHKFIYETQLRFFQKYGLNRNAMYAVGIVEFSSAIALITSIYLMSSVLSILGAIGIALTSIGAIFFHARFDTFKDAIPAILTLLLSSALIIGRKAEILPWF